MGNWPQNWWDLPIAAVDVETTGLSAETDRIIEVAIVHMCGGEVQDRYCTLVNPQTPIGPDSTRITGITDADVKNAPTFPKIAKEVAARLKGRAVLAYNLSFDRGFLERALNDSGESWDNDAPQLDPLILARGIFPDRRSFKLGVIARRLNIPLEEAHRADHDAEAAGNVLYAMREHLPVRLQELLELQSEWAIAYARKTAHWRSGPREADANLILGDSEATEDGDYRLGPSYRYNRDADFDPLRFIYRRLSPPGGSRSNK